MKWVCRYCSCINDDSKEYCSTCYKKFEHQTNTLTIEKPPNFTQDTSSVHKNVMEYDGAFVCMDCDAKWGALPGRPEMPRICYASKAIELVKSIEWLIANGSGYEVKEIMMYLTITLAEYRGKK